MKLKIFNILILIMIIFTTKFSYALIIPQHENQDLSDEHIKTIEKSIHDYIVEKNGLIRKDVKIGDEVYYGKFKEPILWNVLAKTNNSVLLISKYILYTLPYNKTWNPISWENCTLRNWLNNDFYNESFNEDEKDCIIETLLKNHDNHKFNVKTCNDTYDRVFILSSDEARSYFKTNESMKAVGTDYCNACGLWISHSAATDGYSVWWLRTPGKNTSYASLINAGGSVGDSGDGVATVGNGIRPCIWVKIK